MASSVTIGKEPSKLVSLVGKVVGGSTELQVRRSLAGYLCLSPWLLGLIIFWIGPIIASFYFSFTQYDVISAPKWVGAQQYVTALTLDDLFWSSMWRTLSIRWWWYPPP